jgi:hypothetical protein
MIMNNKKFGLDATNDDEMSNEASFNLRVVKYFRHLTYESLINLQYLYVTILETLWRIILLFPW